VATQLIFIIALLVVAFVLSASEVALYSLTSSHDSLEGKVSSWLFKSPQLLLSTILVTNAVVVFLFSLLGASLALDLAARFSFSRAVTILVEVILFSGLLIFFADTIPKIVASRNPKFVARLTLPFLAILFVIASPVVFPLNSFLTWINRRRKRSSLSIGNDGLKALSKIAATAGVIDENEARLLKKIAFLGEKTVRNAMTPRAEIVSVSVDSGFDEVVEILKRCEHSRLPVYSEMTENVIGMLYARDFLRVFRKEISMPKGKTRGKKFKISIVMRKAVFVPETQSLEKLIETYKENKVHIAVVVDEFGGLAGIVTLSDVVREIFGSSAEQPKMSQRISALPDSTYVVKGNVRLEEISAEIRDFDAGEKSSETVSSLLTELHGHVPKLGSKIKFDNFEFEVEQATPKNILQVRLHRLNSMPVIKGEQNER
jgi:putative hemolysin